MKDRVRQERDSLGPVSVPADALWGAQTQRSLRNFAISDERIPAELIHALAQIKQACAVVNAEMEVLDPARASAIAEAAETIAIGQHDDQFPLSVWQTGSGTQTNMNMNEVISNLISRQGGEPLGSHSPVHPNDHVNRSQSTNDVFPAAIHVATSLQLQRALLPELDALIEGLDDKVRAWSDIVKIGRTHLQDAVPLRLSDEVSAWRDQLGQARRCLADCLPELHQLPLGGTAVGTGLNAPKGFAAAVSIELGGLVDLPLAPAPNLFAVMAGHDGLHQAMAQLRRLAVALQRMANDIRLLACGPRAGLGELLLPANEPGSSIMPGKVNPTQCEALAMVCTQVIGLDAAVAAAASGGHLQMNVFKPLIGFNLLKAITLLKDACRCFRVNLVEGMEPDRERITALVKSSLMLVTALTPAIGYSRASAIAQQAHRDGVSLRQAALASGHLDGETFDRLVDPVAMATPER